MNFDIKPTDGWSLRKHSGKKATAKVIENVN